MLPPLVHQEGARGRFLFAVVLLGLGAYVMAQEIPGDAPQQRQPVEALVARPDPGFPRGAIIMTLERRCPDGFQRVELMDGRFPKGAARNAEPGEQGGSATHKHSAQVDIGHTHSLRGETAEPEVGGEGREGDGSGRVPGEQHTHGLNLKTAPLKGAKMKAETDPGSNDPRFTTVLFCARE